MKLYVVATCVMAAVLAAPEPSVPVVDPETAARRALPALEHEEVHDSLGQYKLHYRTAEGTEVTEEGKLVPTPDGQAYVLEVHGETKYVGTDGQLYVSKYSAGLDGTRVEGAHLPVPVVTEPVPVVTAPVVTVPVEVVLP